MGDQQISAALDQHWAASSTSDFETEHRIYHEDAVLEYHSRASAYAVRQHTILRSSQIGSALRSSESLAAVIFGSPNSSCPMTAASYTVSIMEFRGSKGG